MSARKSRFEFMFGLLIRLRLIAWNTAGGKEQACWRTLSQAESGRRRMDPSLSRPLIGSNGGMLKCRSEEVCLFWLSYSSYDWENLVGAKRWRRRRMIWRRHFSLLQKTNSHFHICMSIPLTFPSLNRQVMIAEKIILVRNPLAPIVTATPQELFR